MFIVFPSQSSVQERDEYRDGKNKNKYFTVVVKKLKIKV